MNKSESVSENFLDGRNPQDKGDMARHGLKGKTLAQLRKIRSSKSATARKKQLAHWYINMHKEDIDEDLRKWFREKWVRMDTKGNIKGDCAREPGEGKPKCLPIAKARAMDKKDRATATRRKRREDPVADRPGKGGAPVNVRTEQIEYIEEKSAPTNPTLWSKAKALAKSKFDVYPSAYANGWAAKWYKSKGGGWKTVGEQMEKSLADILKEAKATYCGRCGTTHVPPSKGGTCPALKEAIKNKYDEGEYNREGDMAKSDLRSIIDNAKRLHDMIKDGDNLPEWVQSKITLAEDYVSTVANYMTAEMSEEVEIDEGTQQILRKFVPGYAKHQLNKKMDAQAYAPGDSIKKTVDKDINYGRYKKVYDKLKKEEVEQVGEARMSAAVRMQRALDRIKSERERSERRGKEVVDQIRQKQQEQKPMKEQKSLKDILEAAGDVHPDALHVKPVKVDGKTKYQVHAVGKNFSDGIKKGEHLSDTELDDATEMGARIKHIKEASWFGNGGKKNKSNSVSLTGDTAGHEKLQTRGERMKGEGTEESVDHKARFAALLKTPVTEDEQKSAIAAIKKNIAGRFVSTDKDTDVIKDMDVDDLEKSAREKKIKHHRHTLKTFRAYKESIDVDEAITPRQALSTAADFEFKAANTNDPVAEKTLKGKAKALRRAAATAERAAGTVKVNISKQ